MAYFESACGTESYFLMVRAETGDRADDATFVKGEFDINN